MTFYSFRQAVHLPPTFLFLFSEQQLEHFDKCVEGKRESRKVGGGELPFLQYYQEIDLICIQVFLNRASNLKGTEDAAYKNPKQMQKRNAHIHTHQDPSHWKGIPDILHCTIQHLIDTCFWYLPLGTKFQKQSRGHCSKALGQSHFFPPPNSLMLIKAECLISPRWPVNLNYVFVFLFTVSVCLQFFISL